MRRVFPLLAVVLLALPAAWSVFAQGTPNPTLPLTEDVQYEIGLSDTLDGIGAFFDVSVSCLISTNGLPLNAVIFPGNVIDIPTDCPRYQGINFVPFPRSGAPDVVASNQYDLADYRLRGRILPAGSVNVAASRTPAPTGTGRAAATAALPSRTPAPTLTLGPTGSRTSYVVQPGDSLERIAARFNVDVLCVAAENQITDPNLIFAGQELSIFSGCPPYAGALPIGTPTATVQVSEVMGENLEMLLTGPASIITATTTPSPTPTATVSATPTASPTPLPTFTTTPGVPTVPPTFTPLPTLTATRPPTLTPTPTITPTPAVDEVNLDTLDDAPLLPILDVLATLTIEEE